VWNIKNGHLLTTQKHHNPVFSLAVSKKHQLLSTELVTEGPDAVLYQYLGPYKLNTATPQTFKGNSTDMNNHALTVHMDSNHVITG